MTDIFRDPTEGALARRRDLLTKRRDELVTMPHAIRRVVVARGARVVAATTVLALGAVTFVAALVPSFAGVFARFLPGIVPAPVCTLMVATWAGGVLAYVAWKSRLEHRFAVAMTQAVLPGQDLDHDLERLSHEHPDELARRLAERREVGSAALPVAAAAILLPATAIYVLRGIRAHGWPSTAEFEAALIGHAKALSIVAGAGLVAAVAMTRRFARVPVVATFAGTIALGATIAAGIAAWKNWGAAMWATTAVASISFAVAVIGRKLRKERQLLETEDPAAGSELFTLRGLVKEIRGAFAATRAWMTRRRAAIIAGGVALTTGAAWGVVHHYRHAAPERLAPTASSPLVAVLPTHAIVAPTGSSYSIDRMADGRVEITLHFVDLKPIDIPAITSLVGVPVGWQARAVVEASPGSVELTGSPFPLAQTTQQHVVRPDMPAQYAITSCSEMEPQAIGLHATPSAIGDATLRVSITLELASCEH